MSVESTIEVEAMADVCHKGRRGYYACDYALFSVVKKLHKWRWEYVHRKAARKRFFRKQPHNRQKVKDYKYNERGQRCGVLLMEPAVEPRKLPFIPADIVELYNRLRMPAMTPVPPLAPATILDLQILYAEVESAYTN